MRPKAEQPVVFLSTAEDCTVVILSQHDTCNGTDWNRTHLRLVEIPPMGQERPKPKGTLAVLQNIFQLLGAKVMVV
jgi:hypothetical protein